MSALRSYRLLTTWGVQSIAPQLTFIIPVQFLLSALLAIGLGYLVPEIDRQGALYLATGAPTIAILIVGLVALPQVLSQAKESGADELPRTFPVPATARLAAQMTPQLLATIPGAVLALFVAAWHFDFTLDPSPLALVVLLAVALSGAAIGNAVAALSPGSMVTTLVSNVLLFFVMLFSPINFPADRLPSWLQAVHNVLPIESMAELMRATLTGGVTTAGEWAHVLVWAIASFTISAVLSARRS